MSDSRDQDWIEKLAGTIVDGAEIDWDATASQSLERGSALSEEVDILKSLQRLSLIERKFRSGRNAGSETDRAIRLWGALEIREEIGRGSHGAVYEAFDPALQRRVALKLLRPDPNSRQSTAATSADPAILREARQLARARHPNVVSIYGAAIHNGVSGYWADLVEGPNLAKVVSDCGPLGATEATAVGIELCRALSAVHAEGLIHGDVKPANIVRSPAGHHILLDFSSSLFVDLERPTWIRLSKSPEEGRSLPLNP